MSDKDARFNRRLAWLVLASFIVFASAVVLRLGIGATPDDTTDSAGHPMGFNDPLYVGHYLIMLRNFHPADFLKGEYVYEGVLFTAQVVGAGILLGCGPVCSRLTRWYFVAQAAVFPLGLLALPFLPVLASPIFTGRMDREGFVDIPFILAVAQPVWVVTSLCIAVALRGTGLGLARVRGACAQATRAGATALAKAMR